MATAATPAATDDDATSETVSLAGEMMKVIGSLDAPITALYFSGAWCPDCQTDDPLISKLAQTLNGPAEAEAEAATAQIDTEKKKQKKINVVLVSSDLDETQFAAHLSVLKGLDAVVFTEAVARKKLKLKYKVCARKEMAEVGISDREGGLPTLLVVDRQGAVVDLEGLKRLKAEGVNFAYEGWKAKSVSSAGGGAANGGKIGNDVTKGPDGGKGMSSNISSSPGDGSKGDDDGSGDGVVADVKDSNGATADGKDGATGTASGAAVAVNSSGEDDVSNKEQKVG